jgi:signal peptidase II
MAKKAASFLLVLLSLGLAGCDHVTKHAAKTLLPRTGAVEIVPGFFDLRYAENRDTAFSLSRSLRWEDKGVLLASIAIVVLLFVTALWWRRRRAPALEQVGYAMVVGGAVGNVLDRIMFGYVVDFMHLHRWPIFNVADIAIVAGAALLVFAGFKARPPAAAASA